MPSPKRADRREYLREYQKAWMRRRREAWVAANGPCAKCGSSDRLEVDHVDRTKKAVHVSALWSWSKARRDAELSKCQVLCYDCHKKKTSSERPAAQHGSASKYRRGCRCEPCKEAKRTYDLEYKARPSRWANPARTVIGAGESSREPADAAPTSLGDAHD